MLVKSRKFALRWMCLANIFALLVVASTGVQRNYFLEFTKTACYHNSSHVTSIECSLRNGSTGLLWDMRMELATAINDFKTRPIFQLFRHGMPRMTILDVTLDGCDFLKMVHKQKILSIVRNTLKRYINIEPKCPFLKDFNYTVTGLQVDAQDFPTYVPEGEFVVTNFLMYQNKMIMKTSLYGRVVYLKKANALG